MLVCFDAPVGTVRIERAWRVDAFAVAALALQMELESPDAVRRPTFITEYADAWLADFDRRPIWLAAESTGAAVGFVQAVRVEKLPRLRGPASSWLHLGQVFVTPTHRGNGVGGRLLAVVQEWAGENGIDRIQLNARPAARSLYERAGFESADRLMQWRP